MPQITEFAHRNINKCLGKVTKDQLFIEELWGQILGPGMATVFHTHYNKAIFQRNGWGFVYYLQADQDMGNLALHAEHGSLDYTNRHKTRNKFVGCLST